MTDFYTLCAITIISIAIVMFLKKLRSDSALFLTFLLGIILLRQAMLAFNEKGKILQDFLKSGTFSQYGNVILKAFGISILVEILSDFCKEAGEVSIAKNVEFLGKIEILTLSIPLVEKILDIVKQIIY